MSKMRFMDAEEVKEALITSSDGESDGSKISNASWSAQHLTAIKI